MEFIQRVIRVLLPAIVLIICYLLMYLVFENNMVSFTFLISFPLISGVIIVAFRPKETFVGFFKAIFWLLMIMLSTFVLSFGSGLEGALCIAMAIVPILGFSMLGGIIYLLILRWRLETKGALGAFFLPVVIVLAIDAIPNEARYYEISNTILIDAPVAAVFDLVKSIPDIKPEEIETKASHYLGIPKPTAAVWHEDENSMKRHSFWGSDAHFFEVITDYQKDEHIYWDFEFPENWIKEGIEDPHIKVGGEYFNVLNGGYKFEAVDNSTQLTLFTRTYDGTNLGFYAHFWHQFFIEDMHEVILQVVKGRAEAI